MTMFCDCGNPEAHRGEHIPKPVTDTPLTPDTVRALCDAADEVERLRRAVWASEEIDRRAGMLAGVEAERDASRTAHAALVAELRALVGEWEASPWSWLKTVAAPALRFLLDRHAPTTGETP